MSTEGEVVCVTGGSGCIGSWLVRLLLERGYAVRATVKNLSYSRIFVFQSSISTVFSFRSSACGFNPKFVLLLSRG